MDRGINFQLPLWVCLFSGITDYQFQDIWNVVTSTVIMVIAYKRIHS